MFAKLISRNPDLKRLQDEGYEVEVRSGYLVLRSIPYVTSRRQVALGMLVTDLTLNGDATQRPGDHQVWFAGEHPCNKDGSVIAPLGARAGTQVLCEGIEVHYRFSSKPADGYPDYHAKMTAYVDIVSHPARVIDPRANARTYKPITASEDESVFFYTDSASSRAGIAGVASKLAVNRIAIVGLGGSGSYVLDLIAKTPAREIHLFDGDEFLQHNAFRAPGAASLDTLLKQPPKVAYYSDIYGQMRRGIIPHEGYLNDQTVEQLRGFDFVFLCVDKVPVRKLVSDFLIREKIGFIDVGMELELVEHELSLVGTCRTTLCTPEKSDHFSRHVSIEGAPADDLYKSNIQVADMNALNAVMAVIKWKKYCGFYQDCYREHQSVYAINAHQLTRDEADGLKSS